MRIAVAIARALVRERAEVQPFFVGAMRGIELVNARGEPAPEQLSALLGNAAGIRLRPWFALSVPNRC